MPGLAALLGAGAIGLRVSETWPRCKYHFGGKEDLLAEILERHLEEIDERRRQLLDEQERSGRLHDVDALLRVLVEPLAEKLDAADGRAYLQIQSQRIAHDSLRPATRVMAGRLARAFGLGCEDRLRDRLVVLLLFHALADRARAEADGSASAADRARFVATLKDVVRGAYAGGAA